MPINASYEYLNAEKEYLNAQSDEEKVYWLEEMIRKAPKHKGSENLLVELKTRLRKFKGKVEKNKKKKTGGKTGIRKEGFQFVLVGKANCGKSSLLGVLTNAKPLITEYGFSTNRPEIGTFEFEGVKAQVIDIPSIGSEYFDMGLVNNADGVLEIIESFSDLGDVDKACNRTRGKRIIVLSKGDLLNEGDLRKARERMKSMRLNGEIVSVFTGLGIYELKKKMFQERAWKEAYKYSLRFKKRSDSKGCC
jgi:ribosome-interacting GTPase 1